jgi:hypothetical protein
MRWCEAMVWCGVLQKKDAEGEKRQRGNRKKNKGNGARDVYTLVFRREGARRGKTG